MKTPVAMGLSVSDQYIAVACDNGITRLFSPNNLQYITTLPKPAPLGCEVVFFFNWLFTQQNAKPDNRFLSQPNVYPDVIGTRVLPDESKVVCLYGNRNILVWDIEDTSKITLHRAFPCHGKRVSDLS